MKVGVNYMYLAFILGSKVQQQACMGAQGGTGIVPQ